MESIRGIVIQSAAGKAVPDRIWLKTTSFPMVLESCLSLILAGAVSLLLISKQYSDTPNYAMIDKLSVQMKLKGEDIYKHDQQSPESWPGPLPWPDSGSKIMFTSTLYSNTLNA